MTGKGGAASTSDQQHFLLVLHAVGLALGVLRPPGGLRPRPGDRLSEQGLIAAS